MKTGFNQGETGLRDHNSQGLTGEQTHIGGLVEKLQNRDLLEHQAQFEAQAQLDKTRCFANQKPARFDQSGDLFPDMRADFLQVP